MCVVSNEPLGDFVDKKIKASGEAGSHFVTVSVQNGPSRLPSLENQAIRAWWVRVEWYLEQLRASTHSMF